MAHIVKSYDTELQNIRTDIIAMSEILTKQIKEGFEAFINNDRELAAKVIKKDEEINTLHEKITQNAIGIIALRQPMAYDLRMLFTSFKITTNLERIGDVAKGFSKKMDMMEDYKIENYILTELKEMLDIVLQMQQKIFECFKNKQKDQIMDIYNMDDVIDQKYSTLFTYLITEYPKLHPNSYGNLIKIVLVLKGIERIGDHITNITEGVYYIFKGKSIENLQNTIT